LKHTFSLKKRDNLIFNGWVWVAFVNGKYARVYYTNKNNK